jgi:hypothetical protein
MKKYKIAVLDDYQNVALKSADWSALRDRADIAVFRDHLDDPDAVIARLLPFDVVRLWQPGFSRVPPVHSLGSSCDQIRMNMWGIHNRVWVAVVVRRTAKLNGIDPESYLRNVLSRIAEHPISASKSCYHGISLETLLVKLYIFGKIAASCETSQWRC